MRTRQKKAPKARDATYRGLCHSVLNDISRSTQYGPRPVTKAEYYQRYKDKAEAVGKKLGPRWKAYAFNAVMEAALANFVRVNQKHDQIRVTPKGRSKYRLTRRQLRWREVNPEMKEFELAKSLDKAVGPADKRTKGELIMENQVLQAEHTPQRQPMPERYWESQSTQSNYDDEGSSQSQSQSLDDDYDYGAPVMDGYHWHPRQEEHAASHAALQATMENVDAEMAARKAADAARAYPTPQSTEKVTRNWAERSEPRTPTRASPWRDFPELYEDQGRALSPLGMYDQDKVHIPALPEGLNSRLADAQADFRRTGRAYSYNEEYYGYGDGSQDDSSEYYEQSQQPDDYDYHGPQREASVEPRGVDSSQRDENAVGCYGSQGGSQGQVQSQDDGSLSYISSSRVDHSSRYEESQVEGQEGSQADVVHLVHDDDWQSTEIIGSRQSYQQDLAERKALLCSRSQSPTALSDYVHPTIARLEACIVKLAEERDAAKAKYDREAVLFDAVKRNLASKAEADAEYQKVEQCLNKTQEQVTALEQELAELRENYDSQCKANQELSEQVHNLSSGLERRQAELAFELSRNESLTATVITLEEGGLGLSPSQELRVYKQGKAQSDAKIREMQQELDVTKAKYERAQQMLHAQTKEDARILAEMGRRALQRRLDLEGFA